MSIKKSYKCKIIKIIMTVVYNFLGDFQVRHRSNKMSLFKHFFYVHTKNVLEY